MDLSSGIFHFNPEGSLTDANGRVTWHKLHPLRTEGQGMEEYPARKTLQTYAAKHSFWRRHPYECFRKS